jgi:hypothetical protein
MVATPSSSHQSHDEADDEYDEENEEQDLGDFRRPGSNSAETENGGNDSDDEKYSSSLQHDDLLENALLPLAEIVQLPSSNVHAIAIALCLRYQRVYLQDISASARNAYR